MLSSRHFPIILTIPDDSGFLAIVNDKAYNSFVNEDWEFSELIRHFINEMTNDNLIIWRTGEEGKWKVSVSNTLSSQPHFKEFSKIINVTAGRLLLTNYEELTMAAQFKDYKIRPNNETVLPIDIENGTYKFTIRQMFDPAKDIYNEAEVNFEIIFDQAPLNQIQNIKTLFWETGS